MSRPVLLIAVMMTLASPLALAETVPEKQATAQGVSQCKAMVGLLSKHLAGENPHGAVSTWNSKDANGRMFNSQLVTQFTDGRSFASVTAAPTANGKCDGSYTSVFYSEKSCTLLRETTFKDWEFYSETAGLIVLVNAEKSVNKVLLPGGSGCISINTELVYE